MGFSVEKKLNPEPEYSQQNEDVIHDAALFLHCLYRTSSHKESSNDTTDLMLSPSNNSFLVCSDGFF